MLNHRLVESYLPTWKHTVIEHLVQTVLLVDIAELQQRRGCIPTLHRLFGWCCFHSIHAQVLSPFVGRSSSTGSQYFVNCRGTDDEYANGCRDIEAWCSHQQQDVSNLKR